MPNLSWHWIQVNYLPTEHKEVVCMPVKVEEKCLTLLMVEWINQVQHPDLTQK
jgi:hypothetical protein